MWELTQGKDEEHDQSKKPFYYYFHCPEQSTEYATSINPI